MTQQLEFTISWSPENASARLERLNHNDKPVPLSGELSGIGSVSFPFPAPLESTHRFDWTLMFMGKSLKNLKATVRLDGGDALPVKEHEDELNNRWNDSGLAEEEDE